MDIGEEREVERGLWEGMKGRSRMAKMGEVAV
jgi:hypothetical protein